MALADMLTEAGHQTGRKAISVRTDNGKEYVNEDVKRLLNGIHELSCPYVKQGNGIAERENRILCDTARAMLFNANLTSTERNFLWAEAVNTSAYLRNRIPNHRTGPQKTPFELWFGRKPSVKNLRIFGSTGFAYNHDPRRKKFDQRSKRVLLVGYDTLTNKVFRVFDPAKRSVERVSDIRFTEEEFVRESAPSKPSSDRSEVIFVEERNVSDSEESSNSENVDSVQQGKRGRPPGSKNKIKNIIPHQMVTRSKQINQQVMVAALDPQSYDEAINRSDSDEWKQAMMEEIQALAKNETWILVDLPKDRHLITSKWVFKSKTDSNGVLERRKARLVARGFSQTQGVDFFETFSPVVRYESVRCVLALAASQKMVIRQFDVKTAFLHGKLDEEIYLQQPEGFDDGTNRVCRLQRSLYGLKQSPRKWNERFNDFIGKIGFSVVPEDNCVFTLKSNSEITIICLYVDDGLVCGTSNNCVCEFIDHLRSTFEIVVSNPKHYVGMEISQDTARKTIRIHQTGYITRVLEKFGMSDAKLASIPFDHSAVLNVSTSQAINVPYREAIGCLNYISQISRPDITFSVNTLARYCSKPQATHWRAVKRVLAYLKGTKEVGLVFTTSTNPPLLIGFCDSDWGGETQERPSTSGYIFNLNNGPISWGSRLQKTTALSVAEAEYMAITEALTECLWLRPFLVSLGMTIEGPTLIQADNKAAIALSKNPEFHKRTKHVGIRFHRIRQEQEANVVKLEYVASEDNLADLLTKPLSSIKLRKNMAELRMFFVQSLESEEVLGVNSPDCT